MISKLLVLNVIGSVIVVSLNLLEPVLRWIPIYESCELLVRVPKNADDENKLHHMYVKILVVILFLMENVPDKDLVMLSERVMQLHAKYVLLVKQDLVGQVILESVCLVQKYAKMVSGQESVLVI